MSMKTYLHEESSKARVLKLHIECRANLCNKIANDPPIIYAHTRSISVENPCNAHLTKAVYTWVREANNKLQKVQQWATLLLNVHSTNFVRIHIKCNFTPESPVSLVQTMLSICQSSMEQQKFRTLSIFSSSLPVCWWHNAIIQKFLQRRNQARTEIWIGCLFHPSDYTCLEADLCYTKTYHVWFF